VADDGSAGTSAVSPYRIGSDGTLHATAAAVPDGQTAACWISRAWNGDVFADNAGSGTVAAYQVSPGGQLTFLRNTSVGTGAAPLDNAVSSDGHALYVLNRAGSDLVEFSVGRDAQLTAIGTQAVPSGAAGVAAS
jgi:6-phosphogluconolactonase